MKKGFGLFAAGILLGLIAGVFIGRQSAPAGKSSSVYPTTTPAQTKQTLPSPAEEKADAVPQKVYDVLKYVRTHGSAMDGYVGGRDFSNREKLLPERDNNGKYIQYREWDVNPKVKGQNRGAERLVTGSVGSAWYTGDHYQSFSPIHAP